MSRKQIIILAVAVVLVIAGVIYVILGQPFKTVLDSEVITGTTFPTSSPFYKSGVPQDAVLTTPKTEAPAAPDVEEKLGIYEIRITKNGFDPLTLTVKKGNLVQLRITAVDADYDWSMPYSGLYKMIKKGETGDVGFGATLAGTFVFECRDFCPAKNSKGSVIVVP